VEQYYALDETIGISGTLGTGEVRIWGEMLRTYSPDVAVQMRYEHAGGWLDGQPAMVTRELGAGTMTYLGAWLDDELMRSWARQALERAGVEPVLAGIPDDVEVAERAGEGGRVLILINHGDAAHRVELPRPMRDVLGGGMRRRIDLPPHEVAVLHEPAAVMQ
jgi:beta-galactosidase